MGHVAESADDKLSFLCYQLILNSDSRPVGIGRLSDKGLTYEALVPQHMRRMVGKRKLLRSQVRSTRFLFVIPGANCVFKKLGL